MPKLVFPAVFLITAGLSITAIPDVVAKPSQQLLRDLRDQDTAPAAVEALAKLGDEAVDSLARIAKNNGDLTSRGYAVVTLGQIGTVSADRALRDIHSMTRAPPLLRSWAAAARIQCAQTIEDVVALQTNLRSMPELNRPIQLRLEALLKTSDASLSTLLELAASNGQFRTSLAPGIIERGPGPLIEVMVTHKQDNIRQQAAAYLGTIAQSGEASKVAVGVIEALAPNSQAATVVWDGGALFIPGISWDRGEARLLAGNLLEWMIWCTARNQRDCTKQIHNNLRSVGLARAAGYSGPGWQEAGIDQWLRIWAKVVGKQGVEAMIERQGVANETAFRNILTDL